MNYRVLLFSILFTVCLSAKDGGWILTATPDSVYSPLTLANGMIGILPSVRPLQIDKTILNGVYDIYGRGDGVSNIAEAVNAINLDIIFDNSISLKNASAEYIKDYTQMLDMKSGIFNSRFIFNNRLEVSQSLMAVRHLPHTIMMTITLKAAENCSFSIKNEITFPSSLKNLLNTYEIINSRFGELSLQNSSNITSTGKFKVASSTGFLFDRNITGFIPEKVNPYGNIVKMDIKLNKGEQTTITVIASICSTAQYEDPENESKRLTLFAMLEGSARLEANHKKAWAELWESDIIIEGDELSQKDIRFALYNLYSFVREGTDYSLSPMGLSGSGYNGHIFWDCETWMFPPLLVLHPPLAASLLEYRFKRLNEAKQNAAAHGYKGAMFPWESALSGSEETPVWALTGPFEHHITADIGIAFWQYYQVTQDKKWLEEKGYPLLKEVAEFWLSRGEWNDNKEFEIKNVVCADEYAENVDNNAFTNAAVITVLRNTAKASSILGLPEDSRLLKTAEAIPIRISDDGVTLEHDQYKGEKIKQADVNLLAFPLRFITDKKRILKDIEYYEPRIDHGPAMSHSVISAAYSLLGDCGKAFMFFKKSYIPNKLHPWGVLAEYAGGSNPYFATAAGGMLQAVLFGFGGIEITDKGLVQGRICLPDEWNSLTVKTFKKTKTKSK